MKIFTKCLTITKKRAVVIIVLIAALLTGAVVLRSPSERLFGVAELTDLSDPYGRQKYLSKLGWEIDLISEEERSVLLPREFEGIMEEYARLQSDQGFDFVSYGGLECRQYSYIVTNYPSESTVYAILYVKSGRVIGGDIHSAAIDGFMHGIK